MVKVFEGTDHEYYMDGILKENLDTAKDKIKADWDMVFVYDGMEGSGKSVKAMQDAFYCNPEPDLINRYCFTANQFRQAILTAKKYQAVVYDEAHAGLNARAAMSYINRALVSMLTEIRQKNLFVFIILPTFFDLDRYVALWRSRALIHIYTKGNFERGYFAFYNSQRKKDLYMLGKKLYSYRTPKPNFIGRFTNQYPLDEAEYRKLKRAALARSEKIAEDSEMEHKFKQMMFEKLMGIGNTIPVVVKAQLLGVTKMTYYRWVKDYQQKEGLNVPNDVEEDSKEVD